MEKAESLSKSKRTRQFIIEEAAQIFNKKGYASSSLNDIVQQTRLTKGAIYGNFSNKEEIALAVFEYLVIKRRTAVRAEVEKKANAIDKLITAFTWHKKFMLKSDFEGGCPIQNLAVEADDTNPLLRAKVIEAINQWHTYIVEIIRQGISNKQIKKTIVPSYYATLFISMIEGGIMMTKVYGNNLKLAIVAETIEKIIRNEMAV
jgi:TetR/AcrR family transcriptional repressor of nem operon